MPALGSSHRCTGCSEVSWARAVRHPQLPPSSGAPSGPDGTPGENIERVERRWRDSCTGKGAAVLPAEEGSRIPTSRAAEKGQRVLFSYLAEVQCSWHERDSFQGPQRGRRGCILFSTSAGSVRGKHCWHWDFVLLGFCSVLQIRLLFPWSLCRNGKHARAFKHTLKSIKTVLKYISLL